MASSPVNIENPALPANSIVAVTGASGFIASHITDQLLAAGYRVRGTVRDPSRVFYLAAHFDSTYGTGRFTLYAVPDLAKESAFDDVLDGAQGVIHTVAVTNFDPDPENVVPINVNSTLNVAQAASKSPSVTRFVYTSSSGAAAMPTPGVEYVVDTNSYNEQAVAIAYSGRGPKGAAGGYLAYSAAKTKAEQALWKWYEEEKPNFVLNSIVPNAALGRVLLPEHQGFPTVVGLLKVLWEGHLDESTQHMFPAQWYCDVVDIGRIHVAALLAPDVKSERLIAYAGRFNINDLLNIFRVVQPERSFPPDIPDLAEDVGKIANGRALELIRQAGKPGWTDLKACLTPLLEQYARA